MLLSECGSLGGWGCERKLSVLSNRKRNWLHDTEVGTVGSFYVYTCEHSVLDRSCGIHPHWYNTTACWEFNPHELALYDFAKGRVRWLDFKSPTHVFSKGRDRDFVVHCLATCFCPVARRHSTPPPLMDSSRSATNLPAASRSVPALPNLQTHSFADLDVLVADSCHRDMHRQDWQARRSLIILVWPQLRVHGRAK